MYWASLGAQMVKNLAAMQETRAPSWSGTIPWRWEWLPTPVFLPGEFYGQRSLEGYSPWGRKESDVTGKCTDESVTEFAYGNSLGLSGTEHSERLCGTLTAHSQCLLKT